MEGEGQAVLLQGEAGIGNPLTADASHAASRNAAHRDRLLWFSTASDQRFGR